MEGHVHHSAPHSTTGIWRLFDVYVPRRQCMNYEADVIWLHFVSDILIALAYFSIPLALVYFVRRRRDLAFNWMFLLFALFIILCGTTHLFNVWALWQPMYRLDGVVKFLTGCISLATAILLWRLLPQALALPSPEQLRILNRELSLEVSDKKRAEAEVRQLNESLERRVAERAAELEKTAADLETARQVTAESLALLDTLLMNAPVGIGFYDRELRFVRLNRALGEINGLPLEAHVGKTIPDLLPGLPDHVNKTLQTVLDTRKPILNQEISGETPKRPGIERFWRASYYPVQTGEGALLGVGAVVEDITEQRLALDELHNASRRKDEFLAMLAHELRNPLAPIKNAVQVMRHHSEKGATLNELQKIIDRQVTHLSRLVDDLLDVSRISRGKIKLQRVPIDVRSVVSGAVESSRSFLEARHHRLGLIEPAEPVVIDGDLTRLSQVLVNILINSAKYTPEGGEIEVRWTAENDLAVIRVRDNGMGIVPELLPRVFDLFTQADQTLDRSQGGLGIGLTLVRKLVEAHQGTVEAKSEGLGKGAEFIIRLPVIHAEATTSSGAHPVFNIESSTPGVNRILVVDDNTDSADSLAMLLRLRGSDVRTVYDGVSAISAAADYKPNLVFLDIGLPGMDGYEVARRLKCLKECSKTPLVALTGYGSEKDRERSTEVGFYAHLVKPIDIGTLEKLLVGITAET